MEEWSPFAKEYDPVIIGSIDGTDTEPHDRGIVRALQAEYRPNKGVQGDPTCTVFVARLNHSTTEETLRAVFSKYGDIRELRLVRDIVTGFSKGYAFVEFYETSDASRAHRDAHKMVIDDKEVVVDFECERTLKGWVPRRFGGGLGGMKESGQLRFGCRDRPFRKPIIVDKSGHGDDSYRNSPHEDRGRGDYRDRDRYPGRPDRYGSDRRDDRRDNRQYGQYNRKRSRSRERSYHSYKDRRKY